MILAVVPLLIVVIYIVGLLIIVEPKAGENNVPNVCVKLAIFPGGYIVYLISLVIVYCLQ